MSEIASVLIKKLENGDFNKILDEICVNSIPSKEHAGRYINLLKDYIDTFGDGPVEAYSAAGRTEVGGNHTDHQHGKVLAASVNIDTIAVAGASGSDIIKVKSEGYGITELSLADTEPSEKEYGTTKALIRGIAAGLGKRGYKTGGINACVSSRVLPGSGLSSSASFEVILGNIFWGLFDNGEPDPVLIAKIGQEAENVYFGKPCGLEDQMACSVGGLIHIDFKDPQNPVISRVHFSLKDKGYSLCLLDTRSSHADLTGEYAAIPKELSIISGFFNKKVIREVDEEAFYNELPRLREIAGDRAVNRAIHVFEDSKRVDKEREALEKGDFEEFRRLVRSSGNSSFKYLQNVYHQGAVKEQGVALALSLTEHYMGEDCACRVHGGGFAGVIQAFIPDDKVEYYKNNLEKVFGEGACLILQISPYGGRRVF